MSDTSLLFISYTWHLPPAAVALPSQSGPLNWCLLVAEIVFQSQAGATHKHSIELNKIWSWHYTRSTPGGPQSQWGSSERWGWLGDGIEWVFSEVILCKVTPQECWFLLETHTKNSEMHPLWNTVQEFTRESTEFISRKYRTSHTTPQHDSCLLCWLESNSLCGK